MTPQPNQQEIQQLENQFKELVRQYDNRGFQIEPGDKKIHTREELFKKTLALFQSAITEAKREMVAIIGDDEPTNNLMALSYLSRNNLRAEQRQALTKLTNEIAEDEPK